MDRRNLAYSTKRQESVKMTQFEGCISFAFVIIIVLVTAPFSYGNLDLSSNLLDDDNNKLRYANGESAQIVAQYVEPVSRDIPVNPLFYGFFYGYNISDSLRLISEKYLSASYDTVPEFTSFLDKAMYEMNVTDPFAYYQKPLDPETGRIDPYFHTTAKFCGRKDCLEYWNKAGKFLGKPFEMHLVGLFFTTRTYGIRVKLTVEEQSIFEVDERSNSIQAVDNDNMSNPPTNRSHQEDHNNVLGSSEVVGHEYEGYFHSHPHQVVTHPLYPGIHFYPQEQDFHPTESRAHVTLGCASQITAEQTGLDLLEIIDYEISGGIYHHDFNIGGGDLPPSTLRQYGGDGEETEQVFVIYPSEKMVTQATFSVYL